MRRSSDESNLNSWEHQYLPKYRIHWTNQGEIVRCDYRFSTTDNGFEFKCNTPNVPTVKELETNVVHSINKIWLNNAIELDPTHPHLERDLIKHMDHTRVFVIDHSK